MCDIEFDPAWDVSLELLTHNDLIAGIPRTDFGLPTCFPASLFALLGAAQDEEGTYFHAETPAGETCTLCPKDLIPHSHGHLVILTD